MAALAGKSQAERLWLIGGALAAFVLLLIGYFFFIGPQRSQTSDVNGQADSARQQNASLQSKIETLRQQNKNLPRYESDLKSAQLALPSTSGISDFLRTLQSLGNSTLTNVSALTVGVPTDVSAVAATAPGATAGPAATAPSSAAATPAPSTPSPAAQGAAVYGLPITAQVSGSPAALNRFLEQLQSVQPRAVLITQITEGTGAGTGAAGGGTTLSLTMQAFVAPSSASEQALLSSASH